MTRPAPACRGVPGWLVLVSAAVALTLTLSARAQPPPTTFEEVAARVGIDYRAMTDETWATCAPIFDTPTSGSLAAEYCVPGANTGGATVGDYNGDGLPDLYVLRYDRPALLYENQGDGTFVDVAAEVGVDLAAQVDFAHQQAAGGAVFFNYGIGHGTKANNTDAERAGLAYHFLHADYVATGRLTDGVVYITGPQASGGLREYGVNVADAWAQEVAARAP